MAQPPITTVWPWWLLPSVAVAGTILVLLIVASRRAARHRRRRPAAIIHAAVLPQVVPEPTAAELLPPEPVPLGPAPQMLTPSTASPRASVAAPPRGRIELSYRPARAGLNLISAIVEGELELINVGPVQATDIRVGVQLLGVSEGQDRALHEARRSAVTRLATPPFTLAPGERRTVRLVAALPRPSIEPLTAAGRPMFVPLVAVNVLYDQGEGQTAAAWAVGVERTDSAKLAPLWLDAEPRSFDAVAARAHGAVFMR